METSWTKVYTAAEEYKVHLIQGLLEENDIRCVIFDKKDSAYLFGEIELYVSADDALRAQQIISRNIP